MSPPQDWSQVFVELEIDEENCTGLSTILLSLVICYCMSDLHLTFYYLSDIVIQPPFVLCCITLCYWLATICKSTTTYPCIYMRPPPYPLTIRINCVLCKCSGSTYLHRLSVTLCVGNPTIYQNTNKHHTAANFEGLWVKFLQQNTNL